MCMVRSTGNPKKSVSNGTKAVVEWLSWRVGELVAGWISYRSIERESMRVCDHMLII